MREFTSISSTTGQAAALSAVLAEYLALERTRAYRRRLMKWYGIVALFFMVAAAASQLLWLSLGAIACLLPPAVVWVVELQREHYLASRLESSGITIHGGATADRHPMSARPSSPNVARRT